MSKKSIEKMIMAEIERNREIERQRDAERAERASRYREIEIS